MQPEIFTFCEYAQDNSGKLTIVGTFDMVNINNLPGMLNSLAVAARLKFDQHEAGLHKFKIVFKDPADNDIIPSLEGEINIQIQTITGFGYHNLTLIANNIAFKSVGLHKLILTIDQTEFSLPMMVVLS